MGAWFIALLSCIHSSILSTSGTGGVEQGMTDEAGTIARGSHVVTDRRRPARWPDHPVSMWDWADLLPVSASDAVSLGEGMTPVVPSRLPFACRVSWKNEARNPTGSQKDRAMSLAISHARLTGAGAVIIGSTGSAGLSCAAYCARAGLPCAVLVPRGTPRERVVPIAFHGAKVIEVDGPFEAIEQVLGQLDPARWYQASTVAHVNSVQAEASKTIAWEIAHQCAELPEWVVVPIGGGATIHAIWRGLVELRASGRAHRVPRLVGVQAESFDAVYRAFHMGRSSVRELAEAELPPVHATTVMRNLKHRIPPDGDLALGAVRASGGTIVTVSDEVALADQARLAAIDAVFCEPSSAVVVAAIERLTAQGTIAAGDRVVAVVTGSGLRELQALPSFTLELVAPENAAATLEAVVSRWSIGPRSA
jgi:threonine synthase